MEDIQEKHEAERRVTHDSVLGDIAQNILNQVGLVKVQFYLHKQQQPWLFGTISALKVLAEWLWEKFNTGDYVLMISLLPAISLLTLTHSYL